MSKQTLLGNYLKNTSEFLSIAGQKDMEKLLKYAMDNYYDNTKQPIMNDQQYDMLLDSYQNRFPNTSFSKKLEEGSGHSTLLISKHKKVTLPVHMGSMTKGKPGTGDVLKFETKYPGKKLATNKMDGSSALLIKTDTGELHLYSRGNGKKGTDLSHILPYISKIPKKLPFGIIVRGEIITSKKNFIKYKDKYANPRGLVNSLATNKKPDKNLLKIVDFIAYEFIKPWGDVFTQYKALIKLGFTVPNHKSFDKITDDNLNQFLNEQRDKSLYEIDGTVVIHGDNHERNTDKNPKYAFAFKNQKQSTIVRTTVKEIQWNTSRHGKVKPLLLLEPVKISGSVVKKATAHNAKYVQDNKIGKGTVIDITLSGDIIPFVLKVIKPNKKPDMPTNIKNMHWNKTKVDLELNANQYSKQSHVKHIVHFFETLDIANLGKGMVTRLIDYGLNTIPKILNASIKDLMEIDGIQEKMAKKIFSNIHKGVKFVELPLLMASSDTFHGGLGKRKLTALVKEYPDILEWKSNKKQIIELIEEVDGFSTISATHVATGLPKFKQFLKTVQPPVTIGQKKSVKVPTKLTKFKDKKIVFTGFRNKQWLELLEAVGANITGNISKNTDLLVAYDVNDTSSKVKKARNLGISILSQEQFSKNF
jgi:NAD-dependent DNA ligase